MWNEREFDKLSYVKSYNKFRKWAWWMNSYILWSVHVPMFDGLAKILQRYVATAHNQVHAKWREWGYTMHTYNVNGENHSRTAFFVRIAWIFHKFIFILYFGFIWFLLLAMGLFFVGSHDKIVRDMIWFLNCYLRANKKNPVFVCRRQNGTVRRCGLLRTC